MSLSDNSFIQCVSDLLIHFFYEMDTEDFELAVPAVRKRRFKIKPRKGVRG